MIPGVKPLQLDQENPCFQSILCNFLSSTRKFRIQNSKKSNRSVLFIGHNIYHVYDISDRFVILDRGEVVHQLDKKDIATPEELMKIMRDTIKKH
mgnify:CR=1 FL=1